MHPLRPLPVTGWVPGDYGSLAHRRTNTLGMNPQLLASSSETPLDGGTPRALPKQDVGSASLGVRPLAPLHRLTDRVSTPPDLTRPEGLAEAWPQAKRRSVLPKQPPKRAAETCLRGTGRSLSRGQAVPTACHVPPSWFHTTSTAYSTLPTAGLLHPATDPGVHPRFFRGASTCRPTTEVTVRDLDTRPLPSRRGSYPTKSFPRQ